MPFKNIEDRRRSQKRYRTANRIKIIEYLEENPCTMCGEADPIVLEFDHLDPTKKNKDISSMLSGHYGWKRIKEEINKCQVLCANCHRRKTHMQFNHWDEVEAQRNASVSALVSTELKP